MKKILLALTFILANSGHATETPDFIVTNEGVVIKQEEKNFLHRYFFRDTKTKTALNITAKISTIPLIIMAIAGIGFSYDIIKQKNYWTEAPVGTTFLICSMLSFIPALRELYNYEEKQEIPEPGMT